MLNSMCNDYERHIRWAEYRDAMQAAELGIPAQQSEKELPQADDVRINDQAPVMRAAGNVIELVQMNFSFPPSGPQAVLGSISARKAGGSKRAIVA